MTRKTLILIGGGNMGAAILNRLLAKRVFIPSRIVIVEKRPARRNMLARRGLRVRADAAPEDLANARVLLLAVKPQDAGALFSALRGKFPPRTLVLSIMAGVTRTALARGLEHRRVVRAMPNLAAQVSLSSTAWVAAKDCTKSDHALTERILTAFGSAYKMQSDDAIDRFTAVVGSGPGYLYAFAENLSQAAQALGFAKKTAEVLVRETIMGAALLSYKGQESPDALMRRVASKGGTTRVALDVLKKERAARMWEQAVRAAYRRARELSKR